MDGGHGFEDGVATSLCECPLDTDSPRERLHQPSKPSPKGRGVVHEEIDAEDDGCVPVDPSVLGRREGFSPLNVQFPVGGKPPPSRRRGGSGV